MKKVRKRKIVVGSDKPMLWIGGDSDRTAAHIMAIVMVDPTVACSETKVQALKTLGKITKVENVTIQDCAFYGGGK